MIPTLCIIAYFVIGFLSSIVSIYVAGRVESGESFLRTILWPIFAFVGILLGIKHFFLWSEKKIICLKKKHQNQVMNNKKLTVLVCGFAGTGTTLLARQIEEFLAAKGYECDRIPDVDEQAWNSSMEQKKTDSLIESGLEVVVKAVRLNRSLDPENIPENINDALLNIGSVNCDP